MAQRRALQGIYGDVRDVFRRSSQEVRSCSGAQALEELFHSSIDDTSTIVRDDLLEELKADVVSLPSVTDSQCILRGLPREEKEFYAKEENVVNQTPMLYDVQDDESCGGSRQEYAKFMRRLVGVNMVRLGKGRAKATNSIFFLRKGNGKQRFIISALRANAMLNKPDYVDLGGPQTIAAIQTKQVPL